MVLAVDIGNTNIVLGGYEKGSLCFTSRIATNLSMESDQYAVLFKELLVLHEVQHQPIEGVILSSVVPPLTSILTRAFRRLTSVEAHILTLEDSGGIVVDIENPAELGMDILASAIAVHKTRPLPAVIVDMGTATKLTALDKDAKLRGVSIAPGLFLSLEALLSQASQLLGMLLEPPGTAVGRNSAASIKSGVIYGTADMLDGMIDRFKKEIGAPPATLIATGGASHLVVPHCRHEIELCKTLILDGLYQAFVQKTS